MGTMILAEWYHVHVMDESDLRVLPNVRVHRPARFQCVGPPRQRAPTTVKHPGDDILIGET